MQRIVTTGKGVALDFETVNRDAQANSKELYTWGQNDAPDVRDSECVRAYLSSLSRILDSLIVLHSSSVSDRLAFINFVSGSLSNGLAMKLDAARAPFKQLRDKETALTPRRIARAGLQSQIGRIEAGQEKGYEKRLADLRAQLTKAEKEDEPAEREYEILKRKALHESERLKWEAFREVYKSFVIVLCLSCSLKPFTIYAVRREAISPLAGVRIYTHPSPFGSWFLQ